MAQFPDFTDLGISVDGHVATIEIQRPPHNFFDYSLIQQIATAMEVVDSDSNLRAAVLCAAGKSFCAGANFRSDGSSDSEQKKSGDSSPANHLYVEAVRLFSTKTPIIGAIQERRSAAASASAWCRTSGLPRRKRASPRISPGSVSIPASR